jgi:hypothetical protein
MECFTLSSSPYSKLFKLKRWLTLPEAAQHLSGICGEEVTVADILRLALDGHLTLSVNFVNHAQARPGQVIGRDDVVWRECPSLFAGGDKPEIPLMIPDSLYIGGENFLKLQSKVVSIQGIWDLPMIGAERLDVEHKYQLLTGGPAVTLQFIDGTFVKGKEGVICQLQEDFDDNEYTTGSKAQLEELERMIASNKISKEKSEELLKHHKEDRKKYLEQRASRPHHENYFPAGGLPPDSVFIVRTDALREFERYISENDDAADNSTLSNGHKERHAQNREQVIGAAFAVLAMWPDQCRDSKGKPVASKIADLVEAKAHLFWPDSKLPLTVDSIADHLRDWMKKANSRK